MFVRKTRVALSACLLIVLMAVPSAGKGKPPPPPASGPKNIILLIGDGMGPAQVELGHLVDPDQELSLASMDPLPGAMTTNNYYDETTDSAASGTALATGVKSYNGAISVDIDNNPLETAWERAESKGKSTGILSSVFLTDATPGVWAAHTANRSDYTEIAIAEARRGVEVLLGAGQKYFLPQGAIGTGGPDLVQEMQDSGYELVRKDSELLAAPASANKLVGFFGGDAMTYALNRPIKEGLTEPTLAQMTSKAIEVLNRDPEGFFLVVEGGAIDLLGHKLDPAGVAADVAAFDAAADVAWQFAKTSGNTLVIATADHETGGLKLPSERRDVNAMVSFLRGVKATTGIIWKDIQGGTPIKEALLTHAGITNPTQAEIDLIQSCDSTSGVSDALSLRAGVSWGWGPCEGGHHTPTKVPVYAFGPGATTFDSTALDNTDIGKYLLAAVSR
ncbi:MAG: alkaline phosphatase [Actinomycetota bacterium]